MTFYLSSIFMVLNIVTDHFHLLLDPTLREIFDLSETKT